MLAPTLKANQYNENRDACGAEGRMCVEQAPEVAARFGGADPIFGAMANRLGAQLYPT